MYYYTPGQIVVQEEGKKKPGHMPRPWILTQISFVEVTEFRCSVVEFRDVLVQLL